MSGPLVGQGEFNRLRRPFTFADGTLSVFDVLGDANGINDAGSFVGLLTSAGQANRAFVSYGRGIADLNQLLDPTSGAGWHLIAAYDISNDGQIVGVGSLGNEQHGFLATCVSGCGDPWANRLGVIDVVSTPAIPEPETYALMLAGLGILQLALRRRTGRLRVP
jgi:hypothetical protein